MAAETLLVERDEGVVRVTLNRPHRKNAIYSEMWDDLALLFREVAQRADDRVLILSGADGDFCSGADLAGGEDIERDPAINRHQLAVMRRVGLACSALVNMPKPTIAKVSGVAVGAGMNMSLACDLIVADTTARFSEIFARRGLSIDFGGSWLLPRRVGLHRAKELALLADIIDVNEAERIGLVNRVVEPAELDNFVDDWARRLAAGPPIALAQTKRMLNNAFEVTIEQALDDEGAAQTVNFSSKDTAEAMAAFLDKRDPAFTGE